MSQNYQNPYHREMNIKRILDRIVQQRLLILILLIGFLIRIWGINWGLPEIYEEARPMHEAWKFWGWETGKFDFDPHTYGWPSFSFYVAFITQFIIYAFGRIAGIFHSLADFGNMFETDMSTLVVTHRFVSILFGIGAIVTTFLLGRKLFHKRVGIIAAFFLSFNLLHVQQSKLISPDILVTFLVLISYLFIYNVYKNGNMRDYIAAGFFIGLSTATKYIPILLITPLIVSHILHQKKLHIKNIIDFKIFMSLVLIGFGFFLGSPFNILNLKTSIGYIFAQRVHMTMTHHLGQEEQMIGWLYYITRLLKTYLGILLGVPAFAGGLLIALKSWGKGFILLIFPILYFLVVGSWKTTFSYYILPIIPFLLISAAYCLTYFFDHFSSLKVAKYGVPLTTVVLIFPSFFQLYNYQKGLYIQDTRTLARNWIENTVEKGSTFAMECYSPNLNSQDYITVKIPIDVIRPEVFGVFYDPCWYANSDYTIISSYIYNRFLKDPVRYPVQHAFYNNLENNCDLIKTFDANDGVGPSIKIYSPQNKPLLLENDYLDSLVTEVAKLPTKEVAGTFLHNISRLWKVEGFVNEAGYLEKIAFELNPTHPKTHFLAGEMYLTSDSLDKAIDEFRKAIKLNPHVADFHAMLGHAYDRKGFINEAISEWEKALKIDSTNTQIALSLGNILLSNGRVDQAISTFQHVIKMEPSFVAAQIALATAYQKKGLRNEAIVVLERAIVANPRNAQVHHNLGVLYFEMKKYQKAISKLQEAIEIEPTYVQAFES